MSGTSNQENNSGKPSKDKRQALFEQIKSDPRLQEALKIPESDATKAEIRLCAQQLQSLISLYDDNPRAEEYEFKNVKMTNEAFVKLAENALFGFNAAYKGPAPDLVIGGEVPPLVFTNTPDTGHPLVFQKAQPSPANATPTTAAPITEQPSPTVAANTVLPVKPKHPVAARVEPFLGSARRGQQQVNQTTTGANRTATGTPEEIHRKLTPKVNELAVINNILEKWDNGRDEFLKGKNIDYESFEPEKNLAFNKLFKDLNSNNANENEIKKLVEQRDVQYLKPNSDTTEVEKLTKEIIEKMGKDNDEEIRDSLAERDKILNNIKQAQDTESQAEIAVLNTEMRNARDTARPTPTSPQGLEECLATRQPADPTKKFDQKMVKDIADKNGCSVDKINDKEYNMNFHKPPDPPSSLTISQNNVRSSTPASDAKIKLQSEAFMDLMEKTGRKDIKFEDIDIDCPAADRQRFQKILKEVYDARKGLGLSVRSPDGTPPQNPPQNPDPNVSGTLGRRPG
jgi:hypothetical protein